MNTVVKTAMTTSLVAAFALIAFIGTNNFHHLIA